MEQDRTSLVKIILGIAFLIGTVWFIWAIRGILAPFLLAFVLAYIMSPLIDQIESRGFDRTWCILLIFLAIFLLLGLVVFKAGDKVSDEILRLKDEFLRKDMVQKELLLANRGSERIMVAWRWEGEEEGDAHGPFSIEGSIPPLIIEPGMKEVIHLDFRPADTEPVRGALLLSSDELADPVKIQVRGNYRRGDRGRERAFWRTREYEEEIAFQNLIISAGGIDFGDAGPNIISSISERAKGIQPIIQPYLGEDFDLAGFVTRQGRALIDERLLGGTTELLGGVFSGITYVVLVPFVAFFFLKEGNRITRNLVELVPNAYFELCLNLLHQINGQIGGYIRGQLLATSVVATLAISGLLIIGVDYAEPLGLLAGFANMIPFLGPLIGIISASIVVLATGGGLGLVGKVIVLFLIIQLIDNILIQPTVVAKSVEMHPLVILFAVMVGSQLMGIVGMLIAVPLTGIIKVCTKTVYLGIKEYRTQ